MGTREGYDSLDLGSTSWRVAAHNINRIIKRTFIVCYGTAALFCLPLVIICWAIVRAGPSLLPRVQDVRPATEVLRINVSAGLAILILAMILLLVPTIIRMADHRLAQLVRGRVAGLKILERLTRRTLHDLPDEMPMLGRASGMLDWPPPVTYLTEHGDRIWRAGVNLDAYIDLPEWSKRAAWRAYQTMKIATLPLWPVGLYLMHLTNWYELSLTWWIVALIAGLVLLMVPALILIVIRRKQIWLKTLTDMLIEAYMRQGARA
jgi:hypothetical protein